MTDFLKWLFLVIVGGFISALSFMLLGKIKAVQDLQKDLDSARLDLELARVRSTYLKKREAYEKAIKDYRDTLLGGVDIHIIPLSSALSATVSSSLSASLRRGPTNLH